jgi:hypothetical protein
MSADLLDQRRDRLDQQALPPTLLERVARASRETIVGADLDAVPLGAIAENLLQDAILSELSV